MTHGIHAACLYTFQLTRYNYKHSSSVHNIWRHIIPFLVRGRVYVVVSWEGVEMARRGRRHQENVCGWFSPPSQQVGCPAERCSCCIHIQNSVRFLCTACFELESSFPLSVIERNTTIALCGSLKTSTSPVSPKRKVNWGEYAHGHSIYIFFMVTVYGLSGDCNIYYSTTLLVETGFGK